MGGGTEVKLKADEAWECRCLSSKVSTYTYMSEKLEKEFPEVVLHAIQQATNQSDHLEIPPLVTLP